MPLRRTMGFVCVGWLLHGQAVIAAERIAADDFLIIPGKQIGRLTMPATETDAMKAFPGELQPVEIVVGEGGLVRGSELFPCDPTRNATLFYSRTGTTRVITRIEISESSAEEAEICRHLGPKHKPKPDPLLEGQAPGDALSITQYDWQHRGDTDDKSVFAVERLMAGHPLSKSVWHLQSGVRVGMDVKTLQSLNGVAFDIRGDSGDEESRVLTWRNGKLASCMWDVSFSGAVTGDDSGQQVRSDDPAIEGKASWIDRLTVDMSGIGNGRMVECRNGPTTEATPPQ